MIEIVNLEGRRVIVPKHIWENGMKKSPRWKIYISPAPVGPPPGGAAVITLGLEKAAADAAKAAKKKAEAEALAAAEAQAKAEAEAKAQAKAAKAGKKKKK